MQVALVPLAEEHAKISYKWRNNPKVWELTGSRPDKEITYEIEKEWITRVLKRDNEKRYAILANEVYVGNVQLTNINKNDAEFHIFIGNMQHWGKGIATIATKLLLEIALLDFQLKTVYLWVHKDNHSAIKVYQKNGFKITQLNNNQLKMELHYGRIEFDNSASLIQEE